jgi:isoleucyl-tRNA synthetase
LNEVAAKALEIARDQKIIGSPLDADLTLYASKELTEFLEPFADELRFLFITSSATIKSINDVTDEAVHGENFAVSITQSDYEKCNRCWHRQESVNQSKHHPDLCSRCEANIDDSSEVRLYF